ncbi:NAD(P)-dependent oxidoreductase [Natrinema soli]|uniref:NAD(P)-dependent oxidoreductase n=1 Tax=Natrinema soli TaxID=1930624 RepID=A0ABD5SUQ3_9EURY|nr:NAD(P)-dependent oxidoreductase [Natrinema soli]
MSNTEPTPTVGVIGLGIMGGEIARNLVDDGYDVVVNDVDRDAVETMVEYGADARSSPVEIAAAADVVISSLPKGEHVRQIALGDDGLVEGADDELVYVDMSTIGPSAIREVGDGLEATGAKTIDAPVSGSEVGAREGTLRIMAGCDGEIPAVCRELFDVLGSRTVHAGGLGAGQVVKVCNNMIAATSLVTLSEALVFAEKAGVSQEKLVEGLEGSTGDTWVLQNRADAMLEHDFEPGFFASYQYKDLRIGIEDAQEYGVPVPVGSTSHELFKSLEEKGRGKLDASAILTVLEDMAGLESEP